MTSTIRLRTKIRDGLTSVRAIIHHPMETGFRVDPDSHELVPPHYINQVLVEHNNKIVLSCDWSRAVSKNPYLYFMFKGAKKGERLKLTWVDNRKNTDFLETVIE